ncbi:MULTISPECIES: hypothetical protein [Streptomyces]|uniref:Uncharacterized protein n=1 Tax=Streptomyces griseoaurantiacus TaxID=68213 RepID=A0ABZ1VDS1_9ACTN|nr:hypothetical protein [Streptomyces jietaisiensis]
MILGDIGSAYTLCGRGLFGLPLLQRGRQRRQRRQLLADLRELLVLFAGGGGLPVLGVVESGQHGPQRAEFIGKNGAYSLPHPLVEVRWRSFVLRRGALSGDSGKWSIKGISGGSEP